MKVEVRGMRADEQQRVLRMTESVMGATREFFLARHTLWPGARPEHSRICLVDGQVVSHVRLYEQRLRMGRAVMRCGSIGDVCTLPEHRRRGYGRRLLEDALDYFRQEGFDFSMILSGVFEFYRTAGWEKYPLYNFVVRTDRGGVQPPGGYQVRRFVREADLQQVAAIYEQYNRGNAMSQVRDDYYWRRHFSWLRRETEDGFLVATSGQRIVGYVRCGLDSLLELGYLPGHAAAAVALLEAVHRLMLKRRVGQLTVYLPWREPLVEVLKNNFRCRTVLDETTLVKVVNLRSILAKLLPDLQQRAVGLPAGTRLSLAVTCDGQSVHLAVEPGRVELVDSPGAEAELHLNNRQLFCLLTGSDQHVELDLEPPARLVVETLFGRGNPIFWRIDGV
ncbi:MAG: GNAT family N-acetyltransferase [Phycisphaerae bacterium]